MSVPHAVKRAVLACSALVIASCASRAEERRLDAEERARIDSLSPVPPPPPSPDNPFADDERAAELGHALFFETRWSADRETSCASCHDPARAFAGAAPVPLSRDVPSLRGSAWMRWQTWDGRRDSVWAQALSPLESPDEQGTSRARVVRIVLLHHADEHAAIFGAPAIDVMQLPEHDARPDPDDPAQPHASAWAALSPRVREVIDRVFVEVGRALEAYIRRLAPGESALDRYVAALRAGDPRGGGHLDEAAVRGLRAFVGEAACIECHHGPLLSDFEFHNLGLPAVIGVLDRDRGRADGARALLESELRCGGPRSSQRPLCDEHRFLDVDAPALVGALRTPTLRNVAETAPYMHRGQLATLDAVIGFYRVLPERARIGLRDPMLHPLPRGVVTQDLVAFLSALRGDPLPARWTTPPERDAHARAP